MLSTRAPLSFCSFRIKSAPLRLFVKPYVKQAIADKRNLIYFRFATHEPLLEEQDGLKIINVELNHRFENFSTIILLQLRKTGFINNKINA